MTAPQPGAPFPAERRAIVTGASRGIGAAIARRLAADGYAVLLSATTVAGCEPLAAEIRAGGGRAEIRPCDLADRAALSAWTASLAAECPRLHALVNNAGIVRGGALEDFGGAAWDDVLEVNLRAAFELTRTLAPCLRRGAAEMPGGAAVVNVSSVYGLLAVRGVISYVASKGGLDHLTRGLALELGADGVRVNAVAPGFIRTEMFEVGHPVERQAALGRAHPLGRIGSPEEVAAVVAFLCSPGASFVSGAILPVDGALSCRLAIPDIR